MAVEPQEHGGGIDAARARFGGAREEWLDLSTGINPRPYPVRDLETAVWAELPDSAAMADLEAAVRQFWKVPEAAAVLPAAGASALIAQIPQLAAAGRVSIPGPTYSEHAHAFRAAGWEVLEGALSGAGAVQAQVIVHPNNPDGRFWRAEDISSPLAVIDESFCDTAPRRSLIALAGRPGTIVLKSFGKFWGLAGVRLGFAIGDPALLAGLAERLGPWQVSGPAIALGRRALRDQPWAERTRERLSEDASRLDELMLGHGARLVGGCTLFRLYDLGDAAPWQERLARKRIWSRRFSCNRAWLRLGVPDAAGLARLEAAL